MIVHLLVHRLLQAFTPWCDRCVREHGYRGRGREPGELR